MFEKTLSDLVRGIRSHKDNEVSLLLVSLLVTCDSYCGCCGFSHGLDTVTLLMFVFSPLSPFMYFL